MERIMPPWTLDELEAALPLFPDVTRARLHELHSMWGGSVRWTLARANLPSNEHYFERAIIESSVRLLEMAAGYNDAAKEV